MTCPPSNLFSLYSFAKCSAGRVDTKFVFNVSGEEVDSVPPIICFTAPAWRSMQGRNRVIVSVFLLDGVLSQFLGVGNCELGAVTRGSGGGGGALVGSAGDGRVRAREAEKNNL